jgi:methylated-DNA-[protein]-cysteine S-methyltransferase
LLSASELMMFLLTDRCFDPKAYRAVGNAMNKNPFAPEIPCHRVVKTNGDLGGFAYDISLKIKRLQAEGVSVKTGKIVGKGL